MNDMGYENNLKQKVLISVDTEGPAGNNPVEALIYGKTKAGDEYGIGYLMKLFDSFNAKALFFVDIAEAWEFGEEKIEGVLKKIDSQGHDVGVHLHPDHMADKRRKYLWQYSYNEQYEMIARCTDFYEKVLHRQPCSFRAGRYGANNDTVKILEGLGYKYEMSEFYGNRYCKIEPTNTGNKIKNVGSDYMLEVPVTTFKSFSSIFYERYDKIDSSMNQMEYSRVMKRIEETRSVEVLSFFVHSFSVLKWRKDPNNPQLDKVLNRRLIDKLKWIKENGRFEFIKEKDLALISLKANKSDVEEPLDISYGIIPYWFFFKRALSVAAMRLTRNV